MDDEKKVVGAELDEADLDAVAGGASFGSVEFGYPIVRFGYYCPLFELNPTYAGRTDKQCCYCQHYLVNYPGTTQPVCLNPANFGKGDTLELKEWITAPKYYNPWYRP